MDLRDQLQSTLGDAYTLERELGGGGMSRVFVATESALGRRVVVKVLPAEMAGHVSIERFRREIALAAQLQHPHIVPLLAAGELEGLPWFTMPYVEGESLRVRLARGGELPVGEAVRMLREIAAALAYAHEHGVVHRDVKPDNVLISGGSAMVSDFGVAKALSAASNAGASSLTSLGVALGTPAYMSPEQATADPLVDHRADVYAFGAMAYEMLSGQPPFAGRPPQAMLAAHVTETPNNLAQLRPNVPAPLANLVMRCLAKRAADRPQSARDVMHALDAITTPSGGTAPTSAVAPGSPGGAASGVGAGPGAFAPTRNRTTFRVIAAAAALLLIAGSAWTMLHRRAAPLDATRVLILHPQAPNDAALAPVAELIPDVLARGLSRISWVKIAAGAGGSAGAPVADVTSAARAANAGTVIASSIVAAGDSMQLQVRLLDGATGAVIRAIAPPRLVRGGGADAIAEAMDRVLAAVALVTDPAGGVAALPLGDPPRLAAVLELREGLQAFGAMRAYDTLGRRVTLGHLRRATELDPAFVQPRLFVALSYVWNGALGRNPAARLVIDSVVGEIGAMREKLSPYEGALADALVASSHEIDERALQSVRRVVTMLPLSGIARALPSQLLDLNRPREALSQMERLHALSRGDSTSTRLPEVAYWTRIAEVEHYLGDYRKELDAARQAEAEAPSDIEGKRGELRALAGLADSATLGRKLDDVEGASTGGGAYSFAGDVFLNIAQELVAHDQPALGARVLLRSIRWFDQHPDQERLNPNAGLRHAMALHVAGRLDDAIAILRRFQEANPADLRFEGYLARVLVSKGDTASALEELGRLAAMPSEQMGGVPAQERAFLLARLGPAHWDEAVRVLDESFRQGASFSVRRRLHAFTDWVPLKDYAPFRKVIEPKG